MRSTPKRTREPADTVRARYYKTRDVATLLGVVPRTVWAMVRDGRLPRPIAVGTASGSGFLFPRAAVDAYLDDLDRRAAVGE